MDLRVLRYFLIVAREQNFTKAAQQLHKYPERTGKLVWK